MTAVSRRLEHPWDRGRAEKPPELRVFINERDFFVA
jgi:hypothetical protein